jgi:hypothetical protein
MIEAMKSWKSGPLEAGGLSLRPLVRAVSIEMKVYRSMHCGYIRAE